MGDTSGTPNHLSQSTRGKDFLPGACRPRLRPPALWPPETLTGRAASFPVEVDLSSSAFSFEPPGSHTSISGALKNECALRAPGGGQGAPARPGVAAQSPLLCRQQERFIEKSRVHLMQLSVSAPSGLGWGARAQLPPPHALQQRNRLQNVLPFERLIWFPFLKGPQSSLPPCPHPPAPLPAPLLWALAVPLGWGAPPAPRCCPTQSRTSLPLQPGPPAGPLGPSAWLQGQPQFTTLKML